MIKKVVKSLIVFIKNIVHHLIYPPFAPGIKKIKLVPRYISQIANANRDSIEYKYGPIGDAKAADMFGTNSLEEFSFWAWRSCTIVCLQMVLKTLTDHYLNTMDLITEALDRDGYVFYDKTGEIVDQGWSHQSLTKSAKKYGLQAKVLKFVTIPQLANFVLEDKYLIISIGAVNDSHNILIYGVKINENNKILGFYYHDPRNYNQKGAKQYISRKDLRKKFNNKAIAVWR